MLMLYYERSNRHVVPPNTCLEPEGRRYDEEVVPHNMTNPADEEVVQQNNEAVNEVTYLVPGGRTEDEEKMRIRNEDFRRDEGGTPRWNFVGMMKFGKSYLDLPLPRKLTPRICHLNCNAVVDMQAMLPPVKIQEINNTRGEACNILRYLSPQYLSVMANTDIGIGIDPERSEEHILHKKKQILVREIFATCLFTPGLCETVQTVHTFTEESQLSNGKKIDFGIAGGFEGVQLGFKVANESLDFSHKRRVVAIADLRYQWATTESRIHRGSLYKFLTKDCKDALGKINDRTPEQRDGPFYGKLSHELSRFIEKYGTHVVLKCTHGYRMEKVESASVSSAKNLKEFKAGMMASVLGYAGINVDYQKQALKDDEWAEDSLGIKNIGSKDHMKEALESNGDQRVHFEKMIIHAGEEGDAGVISHDWNMMIAEMLLAEGSPYHIAAKRLQYWTQVRINDLKAGWAEGLFAVSYELKFSNRPREKMLDMKLSLGKIWSKRKRRKSVCVTIGGFAVVHERPHNDTDCLCHHITNVHTTEAKSVRIFALDGEIALNDILAEITVFQRFLASDGVEGRVVASTIKLGHIKKSEVVVPIPPLPKSDKLGDIEIKNSPGPNESEQKVVDKQKVERIGEARAKVC